MLLPDSDNCRCHVTGQAVPTCDGKHSGCMPCKHCCWRRCSGRHDQIAAWRSAPGSFQPLKSPPCTLPLVCSPRPFSATAITCNTCPMGKHHLSAGHKVSDYFSHKFGMPGICGDGAALACLVHRSQELCSILAFPSAEVTAWLLSCNTVWLLLASRRIAVD